MGEEWRFQSGTARELSFFGKCWHVFGPVGTFLSPKPQAHFPGGGGRAGLRFKKSKKTGEPVRSAIVLN